MFEKWNQARRRNLAAGGAKNQKGGHISKIQYWMYVLTGGLNVKWRGTDFKWGDRAPLAPLRATILSGIMCENAVKSGVIQLAYPC